MLPGFKNPLFKVHCLLVICAILGIILAFVAMDNIRIYSIICQNSTFDNGDYNLGNVFR